MVGVTPYCREIIPTLDVLESVKNTPGIREIIDKCKRIDKLIILLNNQTDYESDILARTHNIKIDDSDFNDKCENIEQAISKANIQTFSL